MYWYWPITRFESYKDFYFMFKTYLFYTKMFLEETFVLNISEVKEIKILL